MNGKVVAIVLALSAAIAGGAMYYLQVYGFYTEVQAEPGRDVSLTLLDGVAEPVLYSEEYQEPEVEVLVDPFAIAKDLFIDYLWWLLLVIQL